MIFNKDLIVQSVQDTNENSLDFYTYLRGLESNNFYQVKLTIGTARFFSSEFEVPVRFYDGSEYVDKSYYPTFLEISQSVDGNVTTKVVDVVDTASYYYGSPYYQLIRDFYALFYEFREDYFIQEFFAHCPDFVYETVFINNINVRCSPNYRNQFNYLQYYVQSSNFDLYLELVDNSNQFQILNSLNQVSGSHLTSEDYHDIMAIEAYNRNYLLAHLQPNVTGNLEISGNINATTSGSGGGSSSVDLSGVVTQLQNINEKLNYEDSTGNNADIAEMLFWIAQALQGGLVYADDQQQLQSFLQYIGKKLEYTQTIDDESVTKNITETISDTKDTIANKEMTVINNLDYSDRISSRPKTSGYPDDDLLI